MIETAVDEFDIVTLWRNVGEVGVFRVRNEFIAEFFLWCKLVSWS
jgi:hypothetical protein